MTSTIWALTLFITSFVAGSVFTLGIGYLVLQTSSYKGNTDMLLNCPDYLTGEQNWRIELQKEENNKQIELNTKTNEYNQLKDECITLNNRYNSQVELCKYQLSQYQETTTIEQITQGLLTGLSILGAII